MKLFEIKQQPEWANNEHIIFCYLEDLHKGIQHEIEKYYEVVEDEDLFEYMSEMSFQEMVNAGLSISERKYATVSEYFVLGEKLRGDSFICLKEYDDKIGIWIESKKEFDNAKENKIENINYAIE